MIPLSVSLDHVGPIGRTVADVAAILGAIAGYDAADKSSRDAPVEDYVAALRKNFQPLRIGVPRNFFYDDLNKEVASATTHALSGLATLGAEIRDIELKVSTDRTLQSGESYALHAQFAASKAEPLSAGNSAPNSYREECQPRGLAGMPPRTGTGAPRDHLCFCRCRRSGHANHADSCANDCRT